MRFVPAFAACLLLVAASEADTVVLTNGIQVPGSVVETDGEVAVTLDGKVRRFKKSRVATIKRGESDAEAFVRRRDALDDADTAGWFKLALWARAEKLRTADATLQRVLELDTDHRAARRLLGFEKVDGAWVSGDDLRRKKGFVLAGGRWMLPAEADRLMRDGHMKQATVTKEHVARAKEVVEALRDDDQEVRDAAAEFLTELPDAALVRPLRKLLHSKHVDTRILAIKQFGRIGDRVALPWLIHTRMFDASADVRNAAARSIKGFGDADIFYPYARALFSKSPVARIQAAEALAALGDPRGVDIVLQRVSIGIGASPRANIMVGRQNSYIQDFDVEIAQAAAIGDPIVNTIRDGIILDYKVLGGYGEQWIVRERNAYADALKDLTGRDYGTKWSQYRRYADERELPRVKLQ